MGHAPDAAGQRRMKVLWTHNFDPSVLNAGVFMHNAAAAMRRAGVDLELLYLGNLRSPAGIAKAARLVRERAGEFDLIHSQYGSASALSTAAATNVPLVVSLRGSDWTAAYAEAWRYRLHSRTAWAMTRLALPRYDLAVCVSERIAGEVRRFRPATRTLVLPSPIALDRFRPLPREQALAALGWPEDGSKYVLFTAVSTSSPNKRYALAKAAVDYAAQRLPNVRMLVATGIPNAEMPRRVALADVALCTSINEGWPNSIKEALACNVPFVATDVSDLTLIADRDPACAVVAATPQALGEALIRALSSPRPGHLREHVSSMSEQAGTQLLVKAYEQVCARSRTAGRVLGP